jgi:hypothetical protein
MTLTNRTSVLDTDWYTKLNHSTGEGERKRGDEGSARDRIPPESTALVDGRGSTQAWYEPVIETEPRHGYEYQDPEHNRYFISVTRPWNRSPPD